MDSSTCTSIAQSLVNLTRRWRRRVTIDPRRWGERGWGARWSGGKLLIARGAPFCWVGGGGGGWSLPWRLKGSKGGRAGETRRKGQRDSCATLTEC